MKRILIFTRQSVRYPFVEGQFRVDSQLDILGWETDEERAIQRIREIGPDLVVITGLVPSPNCEPLVRRILDSGLENKVAILNLENGAVQVFGKEPRLLKDIKRLLEALEKHAPAGPDGPGDSSVSMSDTPRPRAKLIQRRHHPSLPPKCGEGRKRHSLSGHPG